MLPSQPPACMTSTNAHHPAPRPTHLQRQAVGRPHVFGGDPHQRHPAVLALLLPLLHILLLPAPQQRLALQILLSRAGARPAPGKPGGTAVPGAAASKGQMGSSGQRHGEARARRGRQETAATQGPGASSSSKRKTLGRHRYHCRWYRCKPSEAYLRYSAPSSSSNAASITRAAVRRKRRSEGSRPRPCT